MLGRYPIYVDLPATDLARARSWYATKLGLEPLMEVGDGLVYESGGVPFYLYQTEAAGSARNTAAAWLVDDLPGVMAHLRANGIEFNEYEMGEAGPTTVEGVARTGSGGAAAWFEDSEGNILSIIQAPPDVRLGRILGR